MNLNNIDLLIRKYYEGESTSEEEKLLYDYFCSESVPACLQKEKEIFLALYTKEEINVPDKLESQLSDMIDQWDKQEHAQIIPLRQKKRAYLKWTGVAACLILVISATLFISQQKAMQKETELAELESNKKVYEQTKMALAMVSAKLNAGIDQLKQTEAELDKATKILNNQFEIHNSQK